ncbi:hypothetical protein HX900_20350 [Rhizobium sp. WYCCWR 11290]|uniref:Uncharacterized protein n=1 Tax=Rhizobium changzhiense TaxID=2692317 RepID=A0A7Z0UBL2_9HYPH|nr:hypothetical protein [Rhizobium changzhiense]NZD63447.1 hypothetical protein [Rhizobium changzhiense]
MVNDLPNERYLIVKARYMVLLLDGCLTIDKYWLSMVVDLESQISKNRGQITALKAAEPAILERPWPKPRHH